MTSSVNDLGGVVVEYQMLANLAFAAATALLTWIINNLTTSVRRLTQELKDLDARHQATREQFVTKSDHKNDIDSMTHRFDRIDDKLDALAKELIVRGA